MLTIKDLNREQLIELVDIKNDEIRRLNEDIRLLEEIIEQLYQKINGGKTDEGSNTKKAR